MTNTVHLHRVLSAPPEKVYPVFVDPDAMAKWLPPHGFTGKVHEIDARVGGGYKMSFTNFTTGKSHSFGGKYVEMTPNKQLRWGPDNIWRGPQSALPIGAGLYGLSSTPKSEDEVEKTRSRAQ